MLMRCISAKTNKMYSKSLTAYKISLFMMGNNTHIAPFTYMYLFHHVSHL